MTTRSAGGRIFAWRVRNTSRRSRFTRFRTTALPIRLLTVTPRRERDPAAGRRRTTRCDVWQRRASRCKSRYSTRRRIRAAFGKRSDPTTRSTGLLRRNADRQALAALVAPTLQDLASARTDHAGPEPVRALPAAVAGLIRSLHLEWVRRRRIRTHPGRQVNFASRVRRQTSHPRRRLRARRGRRLLCPLARIVASEMGLAATACDDRLPTALDPARLVAPLR